MELDLHSNGSALGSASSECMESDNPVMAEELLESFDS